MFRYFFGFAPVPVVKNKSVSAEIFAEKFFTASMIVAEKKPDHAIFTAMPGTCFAPLEFLINSPGRTG